MNVSEIDNLWTRYLDGRASDAELNRLIELLRDDEQRRAAVLADLEVDGMLRAHAHATETHEEFVTRVIRHVEFSPPRESRVNGHADRRVEEEYAPAKPVTRRPSRDGSSPRSIPKPNRGRAMPTPPPVSPTVATAQHAQTQPSASSKRRRRGMPAWAIGLTAAASICAVLATGVVYLVTRDDSVFVSQDETSGGNNEDEAHQVAGAGNSDPPRWESERLDAIINEATPEETPDQIVQQSDVNPSAGDDQQNSLAHQDTTPSNDNNAGASAPGDPWRGGLARVASTIKADWEIQPADPIVDELMSLRSGRAVFEFRSGVQVSIEGPAKFRLLAKDSLQIDHGFSHSVVPPQAIGFTVVTPSSRVIDLGTEFGVLVDQEGATEVRVDVGEVELQSTPTDESSDAKWRLKRGDYKWVDQQGETLDWLIDIAVDENGRGTLRVNGRRLSGDEPISAGEMYRQLVESFAGEIYDVVVQHQVNQSDDYRGMIRFNGESQLVDDYNSFLASRNRLLEYLWEVHRNDGLPENEVFGAPPASGRPQSGGFRIDIDSGGIRFGDNLRIGADGLQGDLDELLKLPDHLQKHLEDLSVPPNRLRR